MGPKFPTTGTDRVHSIDLVLRVLHPAEAIISNVQKILGRYGVGGSRILESSTPPGVPPPPHRTLCRRCERTQTATSGITAFSVGATHSGDTVEMRRVVPMKMITAPAMRVRMGRRGLLRVGPARKRYAVPRDAMGVRDASARHLCKGGAQGM